MAVKKAIDVLVTLQLLFLTQVSFPPWIPRFSRVEASVPPSYHGGFRLLPARRWWVRCVITGLNPLKQFWLVKLVVVIFSLNFSVEAQVSPLFLIKFSSYGMPYEQFAMDPLRVNLVGHLSWLTTNLPCVWFYLIYRYSSGDECGVSSSVCSVDWNFNSALYVLLVNHLLWLWLCGGNLLIATGIIIGMSSSVAILFLCFLICTCFWWLRVWHWSLCQSSCRSFFIHPLLSKGGFCSGNFILAIMD